MKSRNSATNAKLNLYLGVLAYKVMKTEDSVYSLVSMGPRKQRKQAAYVSFRFSKPLCKILFHTYY
ncbi:hypothetical protein E2C01_005176 [Portunus trituberculatus]|uniref:Uncharacterized protein n=1 Tax=Portunus trituberculatus TaxID=210409 RepID=A0A5B7CRU4_PORTR|nr:hypothetical protein [Portunus trituberculatus]